MNMLLFIDARISSNDKSQIHNLLSNVSPTIICKRKLIFIHIIYKQRVLVSFCGHVLYMFQENTVEQIIEKRVLV